jgi:hypothetical protein
VSFSDKGGSKSWLAKLVKFIMGKSGQDAAFSNSSVANGNNFYLRNWLVCCD